RIGRDTAWGRRRGTRRLRGGARRVPQVQSGTAHTRPPVDAGGSRLRQSRGRRSVITESLKPAWSEHFDPPPIVRASGLPVDAAWAFDGADGAGITVAVVDSGVDFDHPQVGGPMS